ncbi:hypothetical protein PG994_002196 [Apiospora phragmitis]|uniref:Uncharacterized protein n=1 Tax=Apiospora phragmitis TaxID=2905665 RepID=A0ABR1WVR5_9PEZI
MVDNALKRRSRPLSPIVEELVSHYESKCNSSVEDEDAELSEDVQEKGQSGRLDTAISAEQCMEPEEGARLSIDNAAAVPADNRETSSAAEDLAAAEESGALSISAETLASSRAASSEGLARLSHDTSTSQKVDQWLQIVGPQDLDDPELASPFVEWSSPRPDLSQLPSPLRLAGDTLDKGKSKESPSSQQGSVASSSNYSRFSEPADYDSSSAIASGSPTPLKESDYLALVRKPSRVISPKPKLRRRKRDVHIHLSLTDSQLEKMASIFASSQSHPEEVPGSPSLKESRVLYLQGLCITFAHRRMPSEDHGHEKYDFDQQYARSTGIKAPGGEGEKGERPITGETDWSTIIRTVSRSRSQDKLYPAKSSSQTKIPTPAQKDKKRPTPLNLADARKYGEVVNHRKNVEVVHNPVPTTPAFEGNNNSTIVNNNTDDSPSVYTSDPPTTSAPVISPLHITKRTANIGRKLNVLRAYNDYKESNTPVSESSFLKTPFRSKSATVSDMKQTEPEVPDTSTMPGTNVESSSSSRYSYSLQGNMRPGIPKSATTNDINRDVGPPEPFTPLTPWLLASSIHIKKNLFGEHGWLKDTSAAEEKPEPQRKSGIFDGLKKVARDLAEKADFKNTGNRPRSKVVTSGAASPRRHSVSRRLIISLDPREQSLLYCELEYTLSNALDIYIKTQLNGGRLDPAKLKKISDVWAAKGRPRVIGFRYDLETQVELVRLHLYQFRFYHSHHNNQHQQHHETLMSGGAEDSTTTIDAVLYAVRGNARIMRVRTLCQPDSVIAKHVLDAQALLGLLGAAEGMHRALAEVSQFFKVVVERERAVRRTREASIRALPHEVAAAMGHDQSVMSVTQGGDVSFQQQRQGQGQGGRDDDEENFEGKSQVPLQYQQQTMPTTTQRQSSQPQQQKVSFASATQSSSAADTSMAEHSEDDQSLLHHRVCPSKLGDQEQQQEGDDSLVMLPSKTYRASSGESSFF